MWRSLSTRWHAGASTCSTALLESICCATDHLARSLLPPNDSVCASRPVAQQRGVAANADKGPARTISEVFGTDDSQLDVFPQDRIRNFSIIAHIDHGKSTLADRLIEYGSSRTVKQSQVLDKLQVERERGITVKANSASIIYNHNGHEYLLNLIDTPGHVDFSYEVSRSLAACQGALLLVDAAQGIQAQTVANFYLAFELDLAVVPVLNKIDLPSADPARVCDELTAAFDIAPESCIMASAKAGVGVDDVLRAIVERLPPPPGDAAAPLRLLMFDAFMDDFRGAICLVLVKDGCVRKGDKIKPSSGDAVYDVLEIGVLAPEMVPCRELRTGQVGYMITGLKSTRAVRVGDTWHNPKQPVEPLPGFRPAKAMMFAGIFPLEAEQFEGLGDAIDRLTLNDASVSVKKESSAALGAGFRCGFLGLLHMDVFMQRLDQEHGAQVLTTTPMVPFRLQLAGTAEPVTLESPLDFPKDVQCDFIQEPTVNCTILVPSEYTGQVLQLCAGRRGELLLPLAELAGRFYNTLKSVTSGYATFDYEEGPYREADLVRLDFAVHGQPVDALSRVLHRSDAQSVARDVCQKIRQVVSRQAYEVAIQAIIGNKVIARETVRATRKDVLAKCYGGDITRKRKLLEKQKEGKARMRKLGVLTIAPEDFHDILRTQ